MKLLTMKKEHLEGLISFARKIKETGVNKMDFRVFNTTKMDEYTKKQRNSRDRLQNTRNMKKKQVSNHWNLKNRLYRILC